jgi:hypothetical protein
MKKIVIHSGIWLVLTYFLCISFSLFLPIGLAIGRAVTGTAFIAAIFYFSGWVLANEFLIKKKNMVLFFLFGILAIIVFSFLRIKILSLFPGDMATFRGQPPGDLPAPRDDLIWGQNLRLGDRFREGRAPILLGVLINTIVSVIAVLIRLYEHKAQKEKENGLKLQHLQEAQIVYLKSQVNPHFLFNTLNNLYGLTYSKSDIAPQVVLGLSDTMRYMIYETEQKSVHIEKELSFIRNYLDLEKIRIPWHENIRVSFQVGHPSAYIPPLLLLPFIENCFKHGNIGREEDGWMELDIWDDNENLYFVCKNSFRRETKRSSKSGIGLMNVKKRLDLIFGDRYELKTINQENEFMVSLQFPFFSNKDQL